MVMIEERREYSGLGSRVKGFLSLGAPTGDTPIDCHAVMTAKACAIPKAGLPTGQDVDPSIKILHALLIFVVDVPL
jgi:hypothetical protein